MGGSSISAPPKIIQIIQEVLKWNYGAPQTFTEVLNRIVELLKIYGGPEIFEELLKSNCGVHKQIRTSSNNNNNFD